MIETPKAGAPRYPEDRLAGFRWHTGATPRPLAPEEPCPILFRDVGPGATLRFLRGELQRLAGPLTPLTYLRTWRYCEPYTDHEDTGRLVIARPLALQPWHSGVADIYVADARRSGAAALVAWVPAELPLRRAAELLSGARTAGEVREALGGRAHDAASCEGRHRLARLDQELAAAERLALPLRRALQGGDRAAARERMERLGISEHDLCAAWHHVPRARRAALTAALLEWGR